MIEAEKHLSWTNRLVLAAGLLGPVVVGACEDDAPSNSAGPELAIAEAAGFKASERTEGNPRFIDVQFGGCILPAEIVINESGDLVVSLFELPDPYSQNPGFIEEGLHERLRGELEDITHEELYDLTVDGITGLQSCLMTPAEVNQKLAR